MIIYGRIYKMKKLLFLIILSFSFFNSSKAEQINFYCIIDTWERSDENKEIISYFKGEEIFLTLDLNQKKIINNTINKELMLIHAIIDGETDYKVKKNYDNYGQNDWNMYQFKKRINFGDGSEYKYTVGLKLDLLDKSPISLSSISKKKKQYKGFKKLLSFGTLIRLPCRKTPFTDEEKQRIMTEDLCCYGFRRY